MQIEFVQYNTRKRGDRSGAYLFMPDGPAKPYFGHGETTPFRIIRGQLISQVHVLHERLHHVLEVSVRDHNASESTFTIT